MDEDTDEIYYTNVACSWLNSKTCSCKDYPNRFTSGEECTKLTREDIDDFTWLPHVCLPSVSRKSAITRMAPVDYGLEIRNARGGRKCPQQSGVRN